MDKLRQITKWYVSSIVCVVFAICAVVYFNAIEGLSKPAGIAEAINFLTESPKEYLLCLICGGLAKIIFAVMITVAVASIICLIKVFYNGKFDYEEFEMKDIIGYIVNCILAVVIGIVQSKIIVSFWILLVTIIIIILCIKAWIDDV